MTEIHTHLRSMPQSPPSGAMGWSAPVSMGYSSLPAVLPVPSRQQQWDQFQPDRSWQTGARPTCQHQPAQTISTSEYRQNLQLIQSGVVSNYLRALRDMFRQNASKTLDLALDQLRLLTEAEWELAGFSGYSQFLERMHLIGKDELKNDVQYKLVMDIFNDLSPMVLAERQEREKQRPAQLENTEVEEAYQSAARALYERLMPLFRYHTQSCSVSQLTGGWNPANLATYNHVNLSSLIRHFVGDYGYIGGHTCQLTMPAFRLEGSAVDRIVGLSQKAAGAKQIDPETLAITEDGSSSSLNLFNSIMSTSHSALLSVVHLHDREGVETDVLIIISDGNHVWFGSQYLGGYYSPNLREMAVFLAKVLPLLKQLFGLSKGHIYTRYYE